VNRLQTPKEISDLLQVSESTVLRMAYSGDLPYIPLRNGRRKKIIRFDPTAVDRWLSKRARDGLNKPPKCSPGVHTVPTRENNPEGN